MALPTAPTPGPSRAARSSLGPRLNLFLFLAAFYGLAVIWGIRNVHFSYARNPRMVWPVVEKSWQIGVCTAKCGGTGGKLG